MSIFKRIFNKDKKQRLIERLNKLLPDKTISERKTSRHIGAFLETVIINQKAAVYVYDKNLELIYSNDKNMELLGFDYEQLREKGYDYFISHLHQESNDICQKREKLIAEGTEFDDYVWFKCIDGNYHLFIVNNKVITRDNKDKPLLFIGTAMPITSSPKILSSDDLLRIENAELRKKIFKQLFSEMQWKVLLKIYDCKTNAEIADQLNISENTVNSHHNEINRKLGVDSPAKLMKILCSFFNPAPPPEIIEKIIEI